MIEPLSSAGPTNVAARVAAIVLTIAARPCLSGTELAQVVRLPRSTTHRLLATLVDEGVVEALAPGTVVVVMATVGPAAVPRADGGTGPAPAVAARVSWRTPLVLGLIGLMAMTTLHVYTLVTWFPAMLEDAGLSATASALLLSWFAGLGLIAAFVVPPLTTRLRNPYPIVVVCVVLMGVGYAGMLAAPAAGAFLWATAFGLGVSTFPLCLTLIGARAADPQSASRLSGVVQGVGYGIGCAGPLTLGAVHQLTDGWDVPYGLLAATLLITLGAGWAACRPVPATAG